MVLTSYPMNITKAIQIGHFILIIILVVALGILAMNQGLRFYYASAFLQQPCELCSDLNPHLDNCIHAKYYEDNTSDGCVGEFCLDLSNLSSTE